MVGIKHSVQIKLCTAVGAGLVPDVTFTGRSFFSRVFGGDLHGSGRDMASLERVATPRNEKSLTRTLNGGHREAYYAAMPAEVTSHIAWKSKEQKKRALDHATKVSGDLSSYIQEHFDGEREKQERLQK